MRLSKQQRYVLTEMEKGASLCNNLWTMPEFEISYPNPALGNDRAVRLGWRKLEELEAVSYVAEISTVYNGDGEPTEVWFTITAAGRAALADADTAR